MTLQHPTELFINVCHSLSAVDHLRTKDNDIDSRLIFSLERQRVRNVTQERQRLLYNNNNNNKC